MRHEALGTGEEEEKEEKEDRSESDPTEDQTQEDRSQSDPTEEAVGSENRRTSEEGKRHWALGTGEDEDRSESDPTWENDRPERNPAWEMGLLRNDAKKRGTSFRPRQGNLHTPTEKNRANGIIRFTRAPGTSITPSAHNVVCESSERSAAPL
jgi:hypothetical protein